MAERIGRNEYLEHLKSFKNKSVIKVITGIRRCGKSTLLEMYQENLHEQGIDDSHIIAINFEDYDNIDLQDPKALHEYIKYRLVDNKMYYVFLDEIQNVKEFPRVVDSLFLKKHIDIYITGSNAFMLSSEIATLLSGRYVEIKMLPLSFKEYVAYTGDRKDLGRKYTDYLKNSSFPYTIELEGDEKRIHEYLIGIYSTVILKDIITRKKIPDAMMLESVVRYVFDNIGNITSTK